jgi:spermidine synthase
VKTAIEQDNRTGAMALRDGEATQSRADRDGISLSPYIHALHGLVRQAGARHVLMIGCGGGTLATMLAHDGIAAVVVDTDANAFALARRYFRMPADIECHVADGAAFLRRDRRRFGAIVMDAYADGAIPRHLLAAKFFALAKTRLAPRNAVFLMNVADGRGAAEIAKTMRRTWRFVRTLADAKDRYNAIVCGGAVRRLRRPTSTMPPSRGAVAVARELRALSFQ